MLFFVWFRVGTGDTDFNSSKFVFFFSLSLFRINAVNQELTLGLRELNTFIT